MVKWLKEAELNNEEVKSRISSKSGSSRNCKSGSSKNSSKSGNSKCSKVSMKEIAIEDNIRLAEVTGFPTGAENMGGCKIQNLILVLQNLMGKGGGGEGEGGKGGKGGRGGLSQYMGEHRGWGA